MATSEPTSPPEVAATPARVSRRPVQVLTKVEEILAALGERGSLGATELAELVDEPRSSVYRLLRTLRQLEYVESERRGQFRLGMRVFQLGAAVGARFSIRQAARPPMERLQERSEQTILLFVRKGDAAVCVERLDGRWVRLEIVDVGELLPLHTGAAPRLLLAALDDAGVDEYLDGARLEQHTEHSPGTPREVRALVDEIRATGVAISDQDLVLGVASIASPVRDHTGEIVAAISYSGIAETLLGHGARERSIASVVEAAQEASRRLGWVGEESGRL